MILYADASSKTPCSMFSILQWYIGDDKSETNTINWYKESSSLLQKRRKLQKFCAYECSSVGTGATRRRRPTVTWVIPRRLEMSHPVVVESALLKRRSLEHSF